MNNAEFGNFTTYKQMVMDLSTDLTTLQNYSLKLKLDGNVESIEKALKKLKEEHFDIAIIGEFKRGKSTLINALLGKSVLPMDVLPTTATLNRITYDIEKYVHIKFKDERQEKVDIDQLNSYVTKLTDESEQMSKTVAEAIVHYPVGFCKNNIDIIDTPGLNDDENMTAVTMSIVPQIDAALMVIMAQSPFSESEREFLESKIITSDLGRVMFVVTGIDLLDEDDVDRVLNNISTRIEQHVLKKAAKTFGEESEEFKVYKRKLGKIKVYGLSAKQALKAKIKDDNELLERSCFPTFEKELERFLTEDRGAIMLSAPTSRILSSSIEILKAIELRQNALNMEASEFNAKYNEAFKEIENIRLKRKEELNIINSSAQKVYDELIPIIESYWPSLEKAAQEVVMETYIAATDIKGTSAESTNEMLSKKVSKAITMRAQLITEQIQDKINNSLENEAERLADFESYFFKATEKIQNLFVSGNSKSVSGADLTIATIGNYFFGLGSVYSGYKQAGWKGALLGGATGFAATMGSAYGLGLLVGAIAVPITLPVVIVVGIGAALVGTFTGKWALSKAFSQDKIDKYKKSFSEAISSELIKMKAESNFSYTVREQVQTAFDALKQKINEETEGILNDTQNQLTQLKVEHSQTSTMSEQEKSELNNIVSGLDEICKRANAVNDRISMVIEGK